MKTWTVFSPYFFPAIPAVLSHASLLEADIAHPGAERALPRPPRPSVWWSSKPLALVSSIHSVQSRRKTPPDHITGLLDAVRYMCPELQQVIPERTRQGTMLFQRRHDEFSAEGLHLACASGEKPQLPPPFLLADNASSRVGVCVPTTLCPITTCKE